MIIFVKEIMTSGMPRKCICCGEESGSYADFCTFINAQKMFPGANEKLELISRVAAVLNEYSDSGKYGIVARAYLSHGVLTVGFTDHLGEWDPVLNFLLSEISALSLEQIHSDIKAEFGLE
jgi:hypothetical protein